MTISDKTLRHLCRKYQREIGKGFNKFLPGIKVRYVAENKKFGYAYFGDFFFFGDDFYVWEKDPKYAADHNQDVVTDVFGNECAGRGYARRVIFAGVLTDLADCNGEGIFTGDVIKLEKDGERTQYLAVGAWSQEDGVGDYCFILDNHNWPVHNCYRQQYQLTRVGTVFYKLNASDSAGVNQRTMDFNGWHDTEDERLEKVMMARYTPNYDQETWRYSGLQIMGIDEYDWR